VGEQDAAVAGAHDAVLRQAVAQQAGQAVHIQLEEALQRQAQQVAPLGPGQADGLGQDAGRGLRHAAHPARAVQRQRGVRVHVQEVGRAGQAQHPVAARALHQVGQLDAPGRGRHQVQGQALAAARFGRAQQRQVQHRGQLATVVVDGRGGAGQRRVRVVEVVALVDDQRLAAFQAGPHRAGAGAVLAPVGAQVEAGAAQRVGVALVPEEVHRDAVAVGQQQHVLQAGQLLVQALQPAAGDADQRLGFLAVHPQLALGDDVGLAGGGRVQPVAFDAALPAAQHGRVPRRGAAVQTEAEGLDLLDVGGVGACVHARGHLGRHLIVGKALRRCMEVYPQPRGRGATGGCDRCRRAVAADRFRCNTCGARSEVSRPAMRGEQRHERGLCTGLYEGRGASAPWAVRWRAHGWHGHCRRRCGADERCNTTQETRMTLPSTSDPRAAAQAVLDALNQGLAAEKSEAVAGLFADESYWRDLVLFTWNLKTMEGPAQITEMLRHQLSPALPVRFELDPKETVEEADGVVSAWLTIDTRLARAPATCA
jgi:hypothetical protein